MNDQIHFDIFEIIRISIQVNSYNCLVSKYDKFAESIRPLYVQWQSVRGIWIEIAGD